MSILVVFTGGTIGSAVNGSVISAQKEQARLLLEMYASRHKNDVEFVEAQPYYALSENNTGKTISALVSCVLSEIHKPYDGIIVAHGTDTLQYSAAALSYALGLSCVPVVLVSSAYVLTDKRANGLENFEAAVDFIRNGYGRGVFVSYKNTFGTVYIHRASRLLAHSEYSADLFSVKNQYYGSYENGAFIKNPAYSEMPDELVPFGAVELPEHCNKIAVVQPFAGFEFQKTAAAEAVIIKAYHSGTLCTADSSLSCFAEALKKENIPCFVCGCEGGNIYESACSFERLGFKILPEASFISQYIKLWMAAEKGLDLKDVFRKSLGGDQLPAFAEE